MVSLLGGPATSLPEGAFYRLSLPPPIMGISAALFRETQFMAAQIQTWITGSLLCFHYKHTGFRLQASALSTCWTSLESHVLRAFWKKPNNYRAAHRTDLAWTQFQPELSGECYRVPSCSLSTCKTLLGVEGLEVIQDWGVLPLGLSIRGRTL